MKKFVSIFSAIVVIVMLLTFAQFSGFKPYAQAKSNLVVVQPSQASQLDFQSDMIELVVDFSGSMSNWIQQSISALRLILPKIDSSTNVGLRVFG